MPLTIPGYGSGVRAQQASVYLPPQYSQPSYAERSFPVVELLDGFPGSPATWTGTLHVATVMDSLIASDRTTPFVLVMPVQNVASPRDTECVNVVGAPMSTPTSPTTSGVRRNKPSESRHLLRCVKNSGQILGC